MDARDSGFASQAVRILKLEDHNTRVVLGGSMLLGMAAGIVGCFMLLRRQALLGDALSHATLPGIGLAYMIAVLAGADGKSLPVLLVGATVTGVLGVLAIMGIDRFTRLKQDTALGIVLSVFFGGGIAVLGVVQKMETGSAAGLEIFIYGKTASMLSGEAWMIAGVASIVLIASILLFKEFTLLSFDPAYTVCQGFSALLLDVLMMALVVTVTVIGLQVVGLILIIALLIIPSAAARFWTHRLSSMLIIAGAFGALSTCIGAALSGMQPRLPAGAMIVLVAAGLFVISLLFAPSRGAVARIFAHVRLRGRIARQHLLRAMYESLEADARRDGRLPSKSHVQPEVTVKALLGRRSWSPRQLKSALRSTLNDGLIVTDREGIYRLTAEGFDHAARLTRNHRLWEMYLVTHADIAPSHVDRDAEEVEHVLGADMVKRLEELLKQRDAMPPSPHTLDERNVAAGGGRPATAFHPTPGGSS